MGIVIGKDVKFYNVPEEVLKKYEMPEEQVKPIKEKLKGMKFKMESDVEGYGALNVDDEVSGFWLLEYLLPGPLGGIAGM